MGISALGLFFWVFSVLSCFSGRFSRNKIWVSNFFYFFGTLLLAYGNFLAVGDGFSFMLCSIGSLFYENGSYVWLNFFYHVFFGDIYGETMVFWIEFLI